MKKGEGVTREVQGWRGGSRGCAACMPTAAAGQALEERGSGGATEASLSQQTLQPPLRAAWRAPQQLVLPLCSRRQLGRGNPERAPQSQADWPPAAMEGRGGSRGSLESGGAGHGRCPPAPSRRGGHLHFAPTSSLRCSLALGSNSSSGLHGGGLTNLAACDSCNTHRPKHSPPPP